jgi:hypothetical protein
MQTAASEQAGLAIQDPGGKNHGKMGGILAGVILLKSPPCQWQKYRRCGENAYSGELFRRICAAAGEIAEAAIYLGDFHQFFSPMAAAKSPESHPIGGANQTCVPSARLIRSAASVHAAPESR